MTCGKRLFCAVTLLLIVAVAPVVLTTEVTDSKDVVTRGRTGPAPSATTLSFNLVARPEDSPDVEPVDRDEFLGEAFGTMPAGAFAETVDPFSGTLHLTMVDVVLPGNAGLDIVIQRTYSSDVLNRVDDAVLARHSASADVSGRLGDSGWQLHMGKLFNLFPGPDSHTTLILPDGSTHPLYPRDGYPGEKITPEGWLYSVDGSVYTVRTTSGLVYRFDAAATAAQYTYLGMDNDSPIQVLQCTRLEDLNGNAITIDYSWFEGAIYYASLIDEVRFDDPTDLRRVAFSYYPSSWLVATIEVFDDTEVVQTWQYGYGEPSGQLAQPQFPSIEDRTVNSLTAVLPPEGNPWLFTYNGATDPLTTGPWLLNTIQTPRVSKIEYIWGPEALATGATACTSPPQFLTLQTRTTSFKLEDDSFEDEATTTYAYADGGEEDATTTIVTTDSQTGAVLRTEEHVFHGWGPYVLDDVDMWKVGREKQSTVVVKDDAGDDLETTTTDTVWEQGGTYSSFMRNTSPWVTCGGFRRHTPQRYVKPTSVTRVIKRHDSVPDPASYTTVTSGFDDYGNPGLVTESSSDGLARTTSLTYWQRPESNLYTGFVEGRDADPGGLECRQYDSLGRLSHRFTNPTDDEVSSCDPSETIAGAREVAFEYDAAGNLHIQTEVSEPDDRVTTHTDYEYGQPKDTVVDTGTGTDIHICREYGPLGTVTRETDGRGCDAAYRTAYLYDTYSRVTSVTPPLGAATTYSYYFDWTQVLVTRGAQQVRRRFDRFGNPKDVYSYETLHWLQFTNDALGRLREETILYNETPGDTYYYDPLKRPTSVVHPGLPASQVTWNYAGSVVTVTDENDHATQYTYEAFGDPRDRRLAELLDAGLFTTSYTYDPVFGELASVDAPLSQGDRSFAYYSGSADCDNGFLSQETHPESGTTSYEYSCLGNVTSRTREGPETTTYDYDHAGRLTAVNYPSSADDVDIDYDGASHRISLVNDTAESSFTYDDAGRLETITRSLTGGPSGLTTTLGYDTLDRLHTLTYPSGRVVTYGWDNRSWLTSFKGEEGSGVEYISEITYYDSGVPDVVSFANGVETDYNVDDRNRLDGIVTDGPGGPLQDVELGYDLASNVTSWQDYLVPGNSRTFGYDALDRLTSASSGLWGDLVYSYDALGNRKTEERNDAVTLYLYSGATNRLTTLTGAGQATFSYDGVGRIAEEVRAPGDFIFGDGFESGNTDVWGSSPDRSSGSSSANVLTYTFNAADQLLMVEEGDVTVGEYAYDGDGLRVKAIAEGDTVYYLRNDAGNTLAEYDGSGELIAEYLYANGRQIGKVVPDGMGGDIVRYFHPDHLGTAMLITNDAGTAAWYGEYEPFGEPVTSTGNPDRYRFTQHELDTETDLVYAKARYYHPRIGRFLSVDPAGGEVGSSQSWNRYAYVQNNPVNAVDPDGELGFLATALVGGLFDAGMQVISNALEGKSGADLLEGTGSAFVQGAVIGATGYGLAKLGARAFKMGRRVRQARAATAQVLRNRAAGNAARDAIAASRPGSLIEQNFRVTGGLRRVDVLHGTTAIESKVGRTSLTRAVRQELARDVKLLRSGQVDAVEWHFSTSPTTGLRGPTAPLRAKLEKFGIAIME